MPRGTHNQLGVDDGYRRCPRCGETYPASDRYFYSRPSTGRLELCRGNRTNNCRREYYREYTAAARARGIGPFNRRFGVEMEVMADSYALRNAMVEQGLQCEVEGYNHDTRQGQWKIVSDSSLSSGGCELVSPPLSGESGREQIRKACAALAAVDGWADSSCGLHVHHEVTGMEVRDFGRLFRFWHNSIFAIEKLVAKSRRNGEWGKRLSDAEVSSIERLSRMSACTRSFTERFDRYRALNVQSYPRYGTVEVRIHQGTVNAEKIIQWVMFGQSTIAYALSGANLPRAPRQNDRGRLVAEGSIELAEMLQMLHEHGSLPQESVDFFTRRAEELDRPSRRRDQRTTCEDCGYRTCRCEDYCGRCGFYGCQCAPQQEGVACTCPYCNPQPERSEPRHRIADQPVRRSATYGGAA